MRLKRSHRAGAGLVFCAIAIVSAAAALTGHGTPHVAPSAVGVWGKTGAPLVTRRMYSSLVSRRIHTPYISVGEPIQQLVLNRDGTGHYAYAYLKPIPFTWTANGNRISLVTPGGVPGEDVTGQGTLSADGRRLTIVMPEKYVGRHQNLWRSLLETVQPPTWTEHYERP